MPLLRSCLLHSKQGRKVKYVSMFEQYQGPVRILFQYKEVFAHVKSNDCHVRMTQLLPIALRGILPANVRACNIKCVKLLFVDHWQCTCLYNGTCV